MRRNPVSQTASEEVAKIARQGEYLNRLEDENSQFREMIQELTQIVESLNSELNELQAQVSLFAFLRILSQSGSLRSLELKGTRFERELLDTLLNLLREKSPSTHPQVEAGELPS